MIVTGGSDGIGLGFCEEWANLGFNICIVARNQTKIEDVLRKIRAVCENKIQTDYVLADFSECQNQNFFADIFRRLEAKDILQNCSVLVNNVGISNIGYIHELADQRLLN